MWLYAISQPKRSTNFTNCGNNGIKSVTFSKTNLAKENTGYGPANRCTLMSILFFVANKDVPYMSKCIRVL